ncbi:Sjoegren syndrome nuclear autoantigen 1 [Trebouxia sp. C0010 RCD-2024]
MAAQGAALQSHNNELVKCIEDLREKREEVQKQIRDEEAEKSKLQQDLQETEGAYIKILESSQTLLTVLKRESVSIQKKRQTSS